MTSFNEDVGKALPTLCDENVNAHLTHFTEIVREMEGRVRHPCKEFIICQQLISSCYGLSSNMSTVIEKEEEDDEDE